MDRGQPRAIRPKVLATPPVTEFFQQRKELQFVGLPPAQEAAIRTAKMHAHLYPANDPAWAARCRPEWLSARRVVFDAVCDALAMDEATRKLAWDILYRSFQRLEEACRPARMRGTKLLFSKDHPWILSALWIAGRSNAFPDANGGPTRGNGITLMQLGCAVRPPIRPADMIKALKEFIHEGVLDQLSNARRLAICNVDIPMMERGLDALMLVHLKFRDTHALLFNPHGHSHQLAIFAWYLFLNAKESLLDRNASYSVNEFILCQCALLFTYQVAERESARPINEVIGQLSLDAPAGTRLPSSPQLALRSLLCAANGLDLPAFREAEANQFGAFLQQVLVLENRNLVPVRALRFEYPAMHEEDAPLDPTRILRLCDTPSGNLRHNTRELSDRYEARLKMWSGELDGRVLIVERDDRHVKGSTAWKSPPGRTDKSPATRNLASMFDESFMSSPLTARPLIEPKGDSINEIVILKQRLLDLAAHCPCAPTPHLRSAFEQASVKNQAVLCERYLEHCYRLIPRDLIGRATYCQLIGVLYYRTLELILQREEARDVPAHLHSFLTNRKFHHTYLAACLEIVDLAYSSILTGGNQRRVSFADVLRHFEIRPFDFVVPLESFIRVNLGQLSRAGVKRLMELEERILESENWKDEEPFYTLMQAELNHAVIMSPRRALAAISGRGGNLANVQTASMVGPSAASASSVSSSSAAPSSSTSASASTGASASEASLPRPSGFVDDRRWESNQLQFFCRKFLVLVHSRLSKLCQDLNLSEEIQQLSWDYLVKMLEEELTLRLFYKRHVDQIIICTLFMVARMREQRLLFKEIIKQYTTQPQYRTQTIMEVLNNDSRTDIIKFYNEQFLSATRQLSLGTVLHSPRPEIQRVPPASATLTFMSPQRRAHLVLSPMRDERAHELQMKGIGSPSTQPVTLYPMIASLPGRAASLPPSGPLMAPSSSTAAAAAAAAAASSLSMPPPKSRSVLPSPDLGSPSSATYVFGRFSGEGTAEGFQILGESTTLGRETSRRRLRFDDEQHHVAESATSSGRTQRNSSFDEASSSSPTTAPDDDDDEEADGDEEEDGSETPEDDEEEVVRDRVPRKRRRFGMRDEIIED